jgi:hypothetical protein
LDGCHNSGSPVHDFGWHAPRQRSAKPSSPRSKESSAQTQETCFGGQPSSKHEWFQFSDEK